PLYEGKQVNCDHPAKGETSVSAYRRFGWLERVRQEADGGLRGNLAFLRSHPLAGVVCEAAERNPALFGLSHNAQGRTGREGGKVIVEAIESVTSVDLVADPATVRGLHESVSRGRRPAMRLSRLIHELKRRRHPAGRMLEQALSSPSISNT